MADLFVEIFPIESSAIPALSAYRLSFADDPGEAARAQIAAAFARQLRRGYGGVWLWQDERIISDAARSPAEVVEALDFLKDEQPDAYASITSVEADSGWQPAPGVMAEFALRTSLRDLADPMQDALDLQETRIRNATVEREHRLQAWVVGADPAISISIASRLIYDQNVQQYAGDERDAAALEDKLAGLWVSDPASGQRGEITGVVGMLKDHRARLLELPPHHLDPADIEQALDGEWLVSVRMGDDDHEYLASSLWLIVRLPHLPRFDVIPKQAVQTLQMTPKTRAMIVKSVSDIAKDANIIGAGYNARTYPERFFSADFEMNLRFGQNRVRPYDPGALPNDFAALGVYHLREAFQTRPVRVAVINTLDMKLKDFVEAMQRQIKRSFDFSIEVIRERAVRVVSRKNLESAARVVEKEDPDIILTFFPDEAAGDDDESDADATGDYLKSLTLGRAIPAHLIRQSTLDDPDAMPGIIMGVLGKTGSAPYVLVEPLENLDYVIGLDIARERRKTIGDTRITAITRIYRADGVFLRYRVRELIAEDETLPYVLVRDLFPQREYAGKRVLIHHDGRLPADLLEALAGWGKAIKAAFYPVEIIRTGAPRIYALEGGITNPPWGSAFKLSDYEALLVSSQPQENITPQPLHVRSVRHDLLPEPLAIDRVLRSVLVWTLLAYGAEARPKYPVTTLNAEQLAYWLGKGGRFQSDEGEVPFWL